MEIRADFEQGRDARHVILGRRTDRRRFLAGSGAAMLGALTAAPDCGDATLYGHEERQVM